MHGPAGDADKRGNVAVQIQQGVHLDGGLALAKLRPRKQRQAQVDGSGVQRIRATHLSRELARHRVLPALDDGDYL